MAEIRMFSGTFSPKYWGFCQGQILAISINQALFSLLGSTYGGNGTTNFALPDLRGRVVIGAGASQSLGVTFTLGQRGGEEMHTLINAEMPLHTHVGDLSGPVKLAVSSAAASLTTPVNGVTIARPIKATGRSSTPLLGFNSAQPNVALGAASITPSQLTITNASVGSNQAHINMQPYLGMNYIICLQGIFPSRN